MRVGEFAVCRCVRVIYISFSGGGRGAEKVDDRRKKYGGRVDYIAGYTCHGIADGE